jgi:hypothetical protein
VCSALGIEDWAECMSSSPQNAGTGFVLLLDDDLPLLLTFSVALERLGFAVIPSHTTSEALGLLRELNAVPATAVVNPAIRDALSLGESLQKQNPQLQLILLAGSDVEVERGRVCLRKPQSTGAYPVEEWAEVIRKMRETPQVRSADS